MRYRGGKHRQGKKIAEIICASGVPSFYIEPFCGAMGSAHRVAELALSRDANISMLLSDAHSALVTMWQAILAGWQPPTMITEE